jgi:hypothetical protein
MPRLLNTMFMVLLLATSAAVLPSVDAVSSPILRSIKASSVSVVVGRSGKMTLGRKPIPQLQCVGQSCASCGLVSKMICSSQPGGDDWTCRVSRSAESECEVVNEQVSCEGFGGPGDHDSYVKGSCSISFEQSSASFPIKSRSLGNVSGTNPLTAQVLRMLKNPIGAFRETLCMIIESTRLVAGPIDPFLTEPIDTYIIKPVDEHIISVAELITQDFIRKPLADGIDYFQAVLLIILPKGTLPEDETGLTSMVIIMALLAVIPGCQERDEEDEDPDSVTKRTMSLVRASILGRIMRMIQSLFSA